MIYFAPYTKISLKSHKTEAIYNKIMLFERRKLFQMFYKMFKIHCKDVTIPYTIKYQCKSYVIAPFRDDIINSNLPIICSKSKKSFLVWMPFHLHVKKLFKFFFLDVFNNSSTANKGNPDLGGVWISDL